MSALLTTSELGHPRDLYVLSSGKIVQASGSPGSDIRTVPHAHLLGELGTLSGPFVVNPPASLYYFFFLNFPK